MNDYNMNVLTDIIGAVESGGQVYGKRDYAAYAPPYANSPAEHTVTLGWAQNYGEMARKLVRLIFDKDKDTFRQVDDAGIEGMLSYDWVANKLNPTNKQKDALIRLITTDAGKKCQDALFAESMKEIIYDCQKRYTHDVKAIMMYCEIRHLGGKKPADRIFNKLNGNYSLDNIMATLQLDQKDVSSNNQVGDKVFWSRHLKCREFIDRYAAEEGSDGMANTDNAFTAGKKALCGDYTAYTPSGKALFVKAGRYGKIPHVGDMIYFYTSSLGRIGHVGGVIEVTQNGGIYSIKTVEGNSAAGTIFSRDGGESAVKSYSFTLAQVGNGNRIDGFGSPIYEDATCTADEFVAALKEWVGYVEKSTKSLNNVPVLMNKLADPGDANVTIFGHWFAQTYGAVYKTGQWCSMYCMYAMYNACKAHLASKDTGWKKVNGRWQYYLNGSAVRSGWKLVDGRWYVFDGEGYAFTSTWFKQEKDGASEWYYLGEDSAMLSGQWFEYKGKWYYLDETGLMVTNAFVKDKGNKGYCYVDSNGEWDWSYVKNPGPGAEIAK